MTRTQISLSEAERAALDAEARRTGRSMSDLIREAVRDRYGASTADRLRAAFASTRGRHRSAADAEAERAQLAAADHAADARLDGLRAGR